MRLLAICLTSLLITANLNAQTLNNFTKEDELNILSWNVYMLPSITNLSKQIKKSHKVKRAKAIVKFVKQSNYDIIVWQETFHHRSRHILQRKLKKLYPHQYGPANKGIFPLVTNSGISIFSRHKMKKLIEHRYKTRYGIDAYARKGFLVLEGEHNGKRFQILGTHLQADGGNEYRFKQMDEIVENYLKKYTEEGVPQFVCGDMNMRHDEADYKAMIDKFEVEEYFLEGQLKHTVSGSEIDYIFVRPNGVEFKKKKRFSIIPEIPWAKNKQWLSDHYAVEGEFVF